MIELADGPSGLPRIESVNNIYNSIFVAQAFAGVDPSPEAVGLVGRDPITGEPADYDPTANSLVSQQVVQNSYGLFFSGDFPGFLNTFTSDALWLFAGDPTLLPYANLYEVELGRTLLRTRIFAHVPRTGCWPRVLVSPGRGPGHR